jgi:hypothetical protein
MLQPSDGCLKTDMKKSRITPGCLVKYSERHRLSKRTGAWLDIDQDLYVNHYFDSNSTFLVISVCKQKTVHNVENYLQIFLLTDGSKLGYEIEIGMELA